MVFHRIPLPPKHQADVNLDESNPATTPYTVLVTTQNCRLISISIYSEWTVQPDPLSVIITIDGQTVQLNQANPVTATTYYIRNQSNMPSDGMSLDTTDYALYKSFFLEGRSIKVEARIGATTAGTVQKMICRVKYAKW